jgi:hypothetical protein
MTRALRLAMVGAAVSALLAAWAAAGVRTTYGGHAAVDEPQYLLTALSLWEDQSLDISDELAAERWRAFHDAELPVQTEVQPDGVQVSPHDPLLPLLLAVPMGLGGWVAAKLTLGLLAAAVAGLTVWVAVRRFGARPGIAGAGTALAFASPPLAVYGSQVYPELPAAGALLAAVAAATGPLGRRALLCLGAAVVALPWLSVKYAPVAAVVAAYVVWRLVRGDRPRTAAALVAAFAAATAAYLGLHRLWWGGWTVYASGDHFVETGELGVMGESPDLAGRSMRLAGLLVDRDYGLAAWAPLWLLLPVAVAALLRRRPPGWVLLAVPSVAGWAVATWVAFTMHGFWWPGRQVVVVLPLLLLTLLWHAQHVAATWLRVVSAVLAAAGVALTATLLAAGWAGDVTWVTGFADLGTPLRAWTALLPDYRDTGAATWAAHGAWSTALVALGVAGWRSARPAPYRPARHDTPAPELTSV